MSLLCANDSIANGSPFQVTRMNRKISDVCANGYLEIKYDSRLVHRAAPNWTLISSTELAEKGGASHEEQGRGNRRMEGRKKEKKKKKRNVEGKRCCVCGTAGTPTLIRYRRSRRSEKNPSQASLEKIE